MFRKTIIRRTSAPLSLGLDRPGKVAEDRLPDSPARVTAVFRTAVCCAFPTVIAWRGHGSVSPPAQGSADFPAVGDWVLAQERGRTSRSFTGSAPATVLSRKRAGEGVQEQVWPPTWMWPSS